MWLVLFALVAVAAPASAGTTKISSSPATVSVSTVNVSIDLSSSTTKISSSTVKLLPRVSTPTVYVPPPVSSATIRADRLDVNMTKKEVSAIGNVVIIQASGTMRGSSAEYNWETSTGTLKDAVGTSPPWRFRTEQLEQISPTRLITRAGDITSCTEDPPHYHLSFSKSNIITGKRARMKNASLVNDELPIFWTPFYTRSLIPKKYTLRIEPGQSSRDGFTNRTILGYPFTKNSRTKLRWDYLQQTGNGAGLEHEYFNPKIKGKLDSYYIRDINTDPLPQARRYSVLWNHYQQITRPLMLNARVDFKSDQTFGNQFSNVGNDVLVENQIRGLLSEGGLNYQFSKASLETQFARKDRFDSSVSSSNFISKLTLPRVLFNTIPIKSKFLPFYTSFSGSYVNETLDRLTPRQTLRYQRSARTGIQIRRDIFLSKKITFTPSAGYDQTWQDRDLTLIDSEKDVYQGRYALGGNYRQRLTRATNLNLAYAYGVRLRRNQTIIDSLADDYGIETRQFTGSVEMRPNYTSRYTFSSGYDMRDHPRSRPTRYRHLSERITPPSLDIQWQPRRNVGINFRETYGLFDSSIQNSVRTPVNTAGEIQFGDFTGMTFLSHGFSYTKPASGQDSKLVFTDKLRFYLTPKWYVSAFLSYTAVAQNKLNYKKIFPIERTLRVVRDMHCWILRMEFSSRPGVQEASFYIDLKANVVSDRNVFRGREAEGFYDYRDELPDITKIFPVEEPAQQP